MGFGLWALESGVRGRGGVGVVSHICVPLRFLSFIYLFFVILYFKTRMTCENVLFFLSSGSNLPCTLHRPVLCIRTIPIRNDLVPEVGLGSSGVMLWLHIGSSSSLRRGEGGNQGV